MKRKNILSPAMAWAVAFITLTGCEKEKGGEQDPPGGELKETFTIHTASTGETSFAPYQIVQLAVKGVKLKADKYNALLGEETVELGRLNDSLLVMLTPDLPAGEHLLEFTPGEDRAVLKLRIEAASGIGDPDAYLQAWAEPLLGVQGAPEGELHQALRRFAGLSAEDKRMAAEVVAANAALFDRFQTEFEAFEALMTTGEAPVSLSAGKPSLKNTSACGASCWLGQFVKVGAAFLLLPAGSSLAAWGAVALGVEVGLSIIAGRRSVLGDQIKAAAKWLFPKIKFPQIHFAEFVYDESAGVLSTELGRVTEASAGSLPAVKPPAKASASGSAGSGVTDLPPLADGQKVLFRIQIPYRTLTEEDASSPTGYIAEGVKMYLQVRDHFRELFGEELSVPEGEVSYEPLTSLDHIGIEMEEGSLVTVSRPDGDPSEFSAVFSAAAGAEAGAPFSFILRYDDGGNISEHRFRTSLAVPDFEVKRSDGQLLEDELAVTGDPVALRLVLEAPEELEIPTIDYRKLHVSFPEDGPFTASVEAGTGDFLLHIVPGKGEMDAGTLDLLYLGQKIHSLFLTKESCDVTIELDRGALVARPSGGREPYTYSWSNGSTGSSVPNPEPGVYEVTVTDANGCISTAGYELVGPLIELISVTPCATRYTDGYRAYVQFKYSNPTGGLITIKTQRVHTWPGAAGWGWSETRLTGSDETEGRYSITYLMKCCPCELEPAVISIEAAGLSSNTITVPLDMAVAPE